MNDISILGGDPAVVIFFLVLVALPITLVVSLFLLRRYRVAVKQSMVQAASKSASGTKLDLDISLRTPQQGSPAMQLQIQQIDAQTSPVLDEQSKLSWQHSKTHLQQLTLAYFTAGMVQALLLLVLYFVVGRTEFRFFRVLLMLLVFAWPVVCAAIAIGMGGSRAKWLFPLVYCLFGFVVYPPYFPQFIALSAMFMLPPALMFLLIGNRWLRAVGPMVVVVVCIFVFTLLATPDIMLWLLPNRFLANLRPFVVLLTAGWLAWWVVRWFASRYQKKQASDQMLQLDAWWILTTLFLSVLISNEGKTVGFLLGLATYFVFKRLLVWKLHPLADQARQQPNLRLLLLRVFGFQGRSESLLESIGTYWRTLGSIQMIAGTDLASATLEPHEFFAYINGRLSRQFIKDAADLAQRMIQIDRTPDADGRYRVNEFFCHDDTWAMTLRQLVKDSHVVLMDLRTFSEQNKGCLYELSQLVDLVPIERSLLLIDATTDTAFLREQLEFMWRTMDSTSPNWSVTSPTAILFSAGNNNNQDIGILTRLLLSKAVREKNISLNYM